MTAVKAVKASKLGRPARLHRLPIQLPDIGARLDQFDRILDPFAERIPDHLLLVRGGADHDGARRVGLVVVVRASDVVPHDVTALDDSVRLEGVRVGSAGTAAQDHETRQRVLIDDPAMIVTDDVALLHSRLKESEGSVDRFLRNARGFPKAMDLLRCLHHTNLPPDRVASQEFGVREPALQLREGRR